MRKYKDLYHEATGATGSDHYFSYVLLKSTDFIVIRLPSFIPYHKEFTLYQRDSALTVDGREIEKEHGLQTGISISFFMINAHRVLACSCCATPPPII